MRALEVTEIVCVQNAFNLTDRDPLPVLHECIKMGIAFVPFCPLGWPRDQHDAILGSAVVARVARRHNATATQVALAWLLALAPNVLLIPGHDQPPAFAGKPGDRCAFPRRGGRGAPDGRIQNRCRVRSSTASRSMS